MRFEEPTYLIELSDDKTEVITFSDLCSIYEDAIRFDGFIGFRLIKKMKGMNVKELKDKIKDLPDHMEVFVEGTSTEHDCSLLNTAKVSKVEFINELEFEKAYLDSLILSEK